MCGGEAVMTTTFNALGIRRRLGRENWSAPTPHGLDGWKFIDRAGRGSIIVTAAPYDDVVWVHASLAWKDEMPTYADLSWLYRGVRYPLGVPGVRPAVGPREHPSLRVASVGPGGR